MDNKTENKKNAQNCGKNNKPVDVKQDNKNKSGSGAKNVKQDNKNCTGKSDKLSNDTIVGGTRYYNNRNDDI